MSLPNLLMKGKFKLTIIIQEKDLEHCKFILCLFLCFINIIIFNKIFLEFIGVIQEHLKILPHY